MMEVVVPRRTEKAMTIIANVAEVRQRRHPEIVKNLKVFFKMVMDGRNPQSYLNQLQRHREIR